MRSKMSKLKLWVVIMCIWYHDMGMACNEGATPWNNSYMNTITKGNSCHSQWGTLDVLGDKLSGNDGVIARFWSQPSTDGPSIQNSHCHSNEKKKLSQQTVRNLPAKKEPKILLRFYDTYTNIIIIKYYQLFVAAAPHLRWVLPLKRMPTYCCGLLRNCELHSNHDNIYSPLSVFGG